MNNILHLFYISTLFLCLIGTVSATDYYVSTNGDNNHNGLSTADSWGSIDYAVDNINNGDTIYVVKGTYTEEVTITKNGDESNYKTLKTYNTDRVIIECKSRKGVGIDVSANYWVIDGFEIAYNHHPVRVNGNKHHVVIKNLELYDCGSSLLLNDGAHNVDIQHCNFYNPHDKEVNFIGLRGEDEQKSHHITITDCEFDGSGHNAINMWDSMHDEDFYGLFDVTIERCTFLNGRQVAIWTNHMAVERMIVRDCIFDNYHRGIQCCMRNCLIENCVVTNHKAHFVFCSYDTKNSDVTVRHITAHAQKHKSNDNCIILRDCDGQEVYDIKISGYFLDANSDYVPSPIKPNPRPDPIPTPDPSPFPYPSPTEYITPVPTATPLPRSESSTVILDNVSDLVYFSTNATWSHVQQNNDITRHHYIWYTRKTDEEQNVEIYDPTFFGLPNDVNLQSGCGPVEWLYLHPIGPRYEVILNNISYSNSTELLFVCGYLPKPLKRIDFVSIDSVSYSPFEYTINNNVVYISTTATIEWNKRFERRNKPGHRTEYYDCSVKLESQYNLSLWPEMQGTNYTINVEVVNHSELYTTLNVNVPYNLSTYTIIANTTNYRGSFIKTEYIYYELYTNVYYMECFDYMDTHGITPYGKNVFLLPYNTNYSVRMFTGTPFEQVELNVNISYIDEIREKREFNSVYFGGLLSFILAFYILGRSFYGSD